MVNWRELKVGDKVYMVPFRDPICTVTSVTDTEAIVIANGVESSIDDEVAHMYGLVGKQKIVPLVTGENEERDFIADHLSLAYDEDLVDFYVKKIHTAFAENKLSEVERDVLLEFAEETRERVKEK